MFNVVLGVILLLYIIGSVSTAAIAIKLNGGVFNRRYNQVLTAFMCCIIGTLVVSIVAAFVLILGG